MDCFAYRNGSLCAEDVPLEKIAAEIGTPFYCYSSARLQKNYREFADAFTGQRARIYYAVKANPNQAVIRTLADCGAGADITSVGELERALNAGIRPEKIVFSGVGKRRDEILAALLAGIYQLNVESIPELHRISEIAAELGREAPVTLRVNPDVDPHTLAKIATGEKETKFGIELAQINDAVHLAKSLPGLSFKGFAMHIGSQLTDYEPFRLAYSRLADLVAQCQANGMQVDRLDLGGGVGIPYRLGENLPPMADYAAIVRNTVGSLPCELGFEPGRFLVGTAGILVSRVVYAKEAIAKKFLILDAGMNDLLRPAMYEARHPIIPEKKSGSASSNLWDVVGPVCETSDLFGEEYDLPYTGPEDLLAILQAGAYGAAMSSNYNGRPLIPEVMVAGNEYAIVRRRIAVAEQIAWESLPPWLSAHPFFAKKT
ncbi:MAG: diaminopimelate decarboxylase [Bdellovibrionales bacterium]